MRIEACWICALASLGGCQRTPAPATNRSETPVPKIEIVAVEKRPIERIVEQPGTVQAFEETVLLAKVPGYVGKIAADPDKKDRATYDRTVDIGSRVRKGQVLAELAVPELDQEANQKSATVRQAEAEVVQSQKAATAAEAGVTAAAAHRTEAQAGLGRAEAQFARWKSEAERAGRLVTGGVIDAQSRDETLNQFRSAEAARAEAAAKVASAEAAVAKARADRDKANSDVIAAEARLDVAKADARRVDALRGYTRIMAPFDGVVTRRMANTGDFVSADDRRGLFAVARLDPVRVVVATPEADAGLVSVGQDVRIVLQSSAGSPTLGKVVRTSWSLEPGTRTLRVEIDLPNPHGAVRPGMFASTRMVVALPTAWALPTPALGKFNEEPVAYLVENDKAVRVAVEPIRGDAKFTQIARYRRAGAAEWTPIAGGVRFAAPAAALADGQSLSAR
jgi:multidrug efflux pump subunit AcrA (membrane-fusion protein)